MISERELIRQLEIAENNAAVSWPNQENRDFEIIRLDKTTFGIGVPVDKTIDVNEKFSGCRLRTLTIHNSAAPSGREKLVVLSFSNPALTTPFAALALDFIAPENRSQIFRDPLSWWKAWVRLTGNSLRLKQPASLIAELLIVKDLTQAGYKPKWGGSSYSIHDIETIDGDLDVKSTLSHSEKKIIIHGIYQLISDKPLEIAFCRLEASLDGYSINGLINELTELGWDPQWLEKELDNLGYEFGSSVRDETYRLVDKEFYPVNDSFPKIVPASFKSDSIPTGITKVIYTVNLDHLDHHKKCFEFS